MFPSPVAVTTFPLHGYRRSPVAGRRRQRHRRCRRRRCPARNGRIDCSNSVGAGGLTTGSVRLCVSVIVTTFPLQAPLASGRSFHGCLYTVPVPSRDRRSLCPIEFELRTVICNVLLQPDHCFLQLSNWRT